MAESPVRTDTFKFVAVRPALLASDRTTRLTTIRDARADTPEGRRHLAPLVRALLQPAEAWARWRELDLSPLREMAEARHALAALYASGAEPPADAAEAMDRARVRRLEDDDLRARLDAAWDALYIAYRTGPDAGGRVEVPTAALRLMHFLQLAPSSALDRAEAARSALDATPLLSDVLRFVPDVAPATGTTTATAVVVADDGVGQVRRLVGEVAATHRLLSTALAAPALMAPETRASTEPIRPVAPGGDGSSAVATRCELRVNTAPTGEVLTATAASSVERDVLSTLHIEGATSLPLATMRLQSHLDQLTTQALRFRSSPALLSEVKLQAADTDLAQVLIPDLVAGAREVSTAPDPSTAPEVDVSGKIQPLGIGDLKVVKQTLLAYVPGEVAHIETVLKGESKERVHRALDRSTTTVFMSEEDNTETERDTQSTDRFELKKEAEKTIKEDMSIKAGLTVTGGYGPVTVSAHGDFAYTTSQQTSQKTSANFARDVVDRSVSKVQTRTKRERTVITLHEIEETNTHGLNNTQVGSGHINGIYRWVDKRYRAQVYNYGRRLMLEFVIPEPAAFYRASLLAAAAPAVNAVPPAPFVNVTGQSLTPRDINPLSYKEIGARYGASGLLPPPPALLFIGTALEQGGIANGVAAAKATKEFTVPEGYTLTYYSITASAVWENCPRLTVQVGPHYYTLLADNRARLGADFMVGDYDNISVFTGSIPVSLTAYDLQSFAVNVQGVCTRTTEKMDAWRHATFDALRNAYEAQKAAYDQKVTQAQAATGISIVGRNPGMNREIEKRELKKLCVTMLTGQHFKQFDAMTNPADAPVHFPELKIDEAMREGRIIQFFEQAFEWEQLTYLYFPYFWGRKVNWLAVSGMSDPDPLFNQFLSAGAARVVVPVSPAYNDAILYYLETPGTDITQKIWQGGEPPHLDEPLFVSIADELRARTDDLAGAVPEGEPWEFTLPTTLVWLQPTDALPTFQ